MNKKLLQKAKECHWGELCSTLISNDLSEEPTNWR